ncbi:low temperature requirement protein A [Streptomyces sp. NPDC004779]|uniref:low temperature requirement protein A n=1 Tax=Streptomyces sp. NPDC004111 TaxID=3364690 RepID=UPI0036C5A520
MSSVPQPQRMRREVSPLELFYDLVFVFAVSQLSHHLLEHLTWRGAAETAVLLIAVFGSWAYTSMEATLLDVSRQVTRWMIIGVMGLGLFMNAAIPHAFDDRAWAFVVPLLAILFGACATTALAARGDPLREHFRRTLVWITASAALWIAGATVSPDTRLWWWGAAALIDLTGTWLAHPLPGRTLSSQELEFDAEHMVERLRLFFIILLGETVLTAGRTLADTPLTTPGILATAGIFAALVALWAVYFGGAETLITTTVAATDPMRTVRLGINCAYVVLAALVAFAVGSELAIDHPTGHGSATLALLLFGGPVLYLAATAWYFHTTAHGAWAERLLGCAALIAAGVAAIWIPPLASIALLDIILITTALVLTYTHRSLAHTLSTPPHA